MSANRLSLQPPLAAGFSRLGFGSLPLERLKLRYGNATVEIDGFNVHVPCIAQKDR
jgi:hypothetical protein